MRRQLESRRLRVALAILLAAGVLALLLARSENLRWKDAGGAYAGDFIHEYAAAWLVLHDPARLYDLEAVYAVQHDRDRMGFAWDGDRVNVPYYPPPYYALVSPLAWLDYRSAANAWIALQLAALALAVALLVRAHPELAGSLPLTLPAVLLFPPVATGLVSGQKGTLWLLVLAATYLALLRGRRLVAGLVFGVLLLKPPLALVVGLVMVVRREWAFLAGAAATVLCLVGLSWAVLGGEGWADWLGVLRDPVAQDRAELVARSHCWLGFVRVALGSYAGAGVLALTAGLDLVTLAALWPLWRGPLEAGSAQLRAAFAAAVAATLLVSPHLYPYDLTLLVATFAIAASLPTAGATGSAMLRRTLLGVFLLASAVTTTGHPAALLASVPALFALQLLLVRLGRGASADGAPGGSRRSAGPPRPPGDPGSEDPQRQADPYDVRLFNRF